MTKIKVVSDIHAEFDTDKGVRFINSLPNDDVDVLVLAGDIGTKDIIEQTLAMFCDKFKNVVYVQGNHDCWYQSLDEARELITNISAKHSNLYWLDNRRVKIEGVNFIGTTLWFPEVEPMPGKISWIDFRKVEGGCHTIFDEYKKASYYLWNNIEEGDIVVTHHMPCDECVHEQWEGNDYNCYFHAEEKPTILRKKPYMWIFGHTHTFRNFQIYATHLLCNPRGYPHEKTGFLPDLIVNIK